METLVSILVPTAVGTAVTRSAVNYILPPLLPHTPVASADRYALIKPSISPSITALILAFSKVGTGILGKGIRHENIGADLNCPIRSLLLNALNVRDFLEVLALLDLNQL